MKKIILHSLLTSSIIGYQLITGFAMPTSVPASSTAPIGGVYSDYFSNISKPANPTIINPIIVGFNMLDNMTPAYISAEVLVTNYLKTLGALGGDRVLNGFDIAGNIVASSMDSLVKGFLNGKMAGANNAIYGFNALGNVISSQEIGYWKGMFPSGIGYTDGNVTINGNVRLYGNARSKNATQPSHLVPLGQIDSQISSLNSAIAP